jgi:hypothetical protein
MRTISRLFDSHAEAAHAIGALQAAGVPRVEITVIGPYEDEVGAALRGPGLVGALGAAFASLAGLSAFAINGVDPLGAGLLATTVVGAACGGVAGWFLGIFAEVAIRPGEPSVDQGVSLVMANVDEKQADTAQAVLGHSVQMTELVARAA